MRSSTRSFYTCIRQGYHSQLMYISIFPSWPLCCALGELQGEVVGDPFFIIPLNKSGNYMYHFINVSETLHFAERVYVYMYVCISCESQTAIGFLSNYINRLACVIFL
jgi:hypothetical protein